MGDCRFENTCCDLLDCLDALRQYQPVSESEYRAAYRMIRHFLCFCKDADIIRSFDHEAIIKHLDQMKAVSYTHLKSRKHAQKDDLFDDNVPQQDIPCLLYTSRCV